MGKPAGEMLQGTLDLLILRTLLRGPMHGYGIAESLKTITDEVLKVEEGSLYPGLHRLEVNGFISAKWGTSANNRRAKFYQLTAAGRKQLHVETTRWQRLAAAVARVIEPA